MSWAEHVARTGDNINAYRGLVEKSEAKRPHGRRGIAGSITLKINDEEMGLDDVGSIRVAQDRERWWAVVNTAMNIWVP
jgi:hypothetical protein